MEQLFLTRRNLLTLLSKLDRKQDGDSTHCTIIKNDIVHSKYPSTVPVTVTAIEDEEYYTDRSPGSVHPGDDPTLKEHH